MLVVDQRRHAVAGGFGEPYVARNHGVVQLVAEMRLELFGNVVGQAAARVVHGAQQTFDLQTRIECLTDALDRVDQIGQTLERVVLSHCMGMITPSAAASALMVSIDSDGGQSMRM